LLKKVYYQNKKKETPKKEKKYNDGYDDEHADYIINPDEVFNERYVVQSVLGKVKRFVYRLSNLN
jgi:DNA-dependent RNA polymerase auxiliary subunit epsilon